MQLSGNVAANLLISLWLLALRIVGTRELILALGVEGYGVLILVTSLTTMLGFASGGVAGAVVKHVAQDLAVGDRDGARRMVGSGLVICAAAGTIVFAALAGGSGLIVDRVLHVSDELAGVARTVVLLTGAGFGITLAGGIYYSILVALQRYEVLVTAHLAAVTALTAAQIAAARSGMGLAWVAAAGLAFAVVDLALLAGFVARFEAGLVWKPAVGLDALKKICSFGGFRTLDMAGTIALLHVDRVSIGTLLGAGAVAYYSVPQAVAVQLSHVGGALAEPLFPRLSHLSAVRDREGMRALYRRASRLLTWFVAASVGCGVVMSDVLLRYWLGGTFTEQAAPIMGWLLLGWGVMTVGLVSVSALNALGLPEVNAAVRAVQVAIMLAACLLLVPRFGAVAAAQGVTLAAALTVPVVLTCVARKLELADAVSDLYLRPLAVGLGVATVGWLLKRPGAPVLYEVQVLALMAATAVGLGVSLGTLRRDEIALARALTGGLWSRVKGLWRGPASVDARR